MIEIFHIDDQMHIAETRVWSWLVRFRVGNQCERCGSFEEIIAHHKNHDESDNTLINGECLCRTCHGKHHRAFDSEETHARRRSSGWGGKHSRQRKQD